MSEWQRPSECSDAACVEVRRMEVGVQIRVSAEPIYVLRAKSEEWAAFVAAVKAGEFDEV